LADYETRADDFRAAGVRLVAASVDTEDDARKVTRELKLSYPIAYALSAPEISASTGAYCEPVKRYLHATGFILKPDASIAAAVYSTGAIGRYTAADALDMIRALANKK
jgi:alkyl hydroperoxide reductase subunit AhpC